VLEAHGVFRRPHAASLDGKKISFIVSLELSRRLFSLRATHGVGNGAVCHRGCFLSFFLSPPSKITLTIQDFRVVLLFIEISTSVLILLISNFYF